MVTLCGCSDGSQAFREPPAESFGVHKKSVKTGAITAPAQGAEVTKDFFPATGAQPMLGRFLIDGDFAAAAPLTVVLSSDMWTERLNASPTAIGRTIEVGGHSATIVGVAPKTFDLPPGSQFWMPKKS
ncbi:MAG TPA: ABC transporter permease [Vicinamibacterales bacterium]